MRNLFFIVLSVAGFASCIEPRAFGDAGNKKPFKTYEVDGKQSPIYGLLMREDAIFEIEMTQLAFVPPLSDPSKYTGITKGRLIRVYKGTGEPGKEIEFVGGISDWKLGDKMIVILGADRKSHLTFIKGRSGSYDDFVSAIGPFAGKISEENKDLKKAVVEMRKKLQKDCEGATSKRDAARCRYRAELW